MPQDDNADSSPAQDEAAAPSAAVTATPAVSPVVEAPEAPAAPEVSPLDKLRTKLVDKPEAAAETPADEPATEEVPAETPAEEPAADPEAPAVDAPPEPTEDEPLKGFTEAEIRHPSNKGMVDRIRQLAKQKKELEPHRSRSAFLERYEQQGLQPEDVQAALDLAVGFQRGDESALTMLETAAADLRKDLGRAEPAAAPKIEPFIGKLPQHYQDMVDTLGMAEADVRALAGFDQWRKNPAPAPAARPAPPVRPPVDRARQVQEQALSDGANRAVNTYLAQHKLDTKSLMPHLVAIAPGGDPRRFAPEQRLRALELAHQHLRLAQVKAKAGERRAAAPPAIKPSTTPPATRAGAKVTNPLADLRSRLVAARR